MPLHQNISLKSVVAHSIDSKSYQSDPSYRIVEGRRYPCVMKPTKDFRFDLHNNMVFESSLTEILPFHARHNRSLRHIVAMSSTVSGISPRTCFLRMYLLFLISLHRRFEATFYWSCSHIDFLLIGLKLTRDGSLTKSSV